MSLPRTFSLERTAPRRRRAVEAGGTDLCACVYVGPASAGVDLEVGEGPVAARVRGGGMPQRDYHASLASGERVRVHGAPPRMAVESDRHAPVEVRVREEGRGWRSFTLVEDGPIAGVLWTAPGPEAWRLDVAGGAEPLRVLAILHAAERLLREIEAGGHRER